MSLATDRTVNTGTLTNINNSQLAVNDGLSFSVAATTYDSQGSFTTAGTRTMFSAQQSGSLLDLSSIQQWDASWNDNNSGTTVQKVEATDGGTVDLSGLQTLLTPDRSEDRIDFVASSGGTIDLASLSTISGTGQARLTISDGSVIRLGTLLQSGNTHISVNDLTSVLDVASSLDLDAGAFSLEAGATIEIGGNFSLSYTNESNFSANSGVIHLDGAGGQQFEVGGEDLGVPGPSSGNFGIGQLMIGRTAQRSNADLLDVVDNGNRGGGGESEALYLYGLGGPDGLRILNNSALVLNGINVYAWEAAQAQMVHLNSLFQPGDLRIDYDDGYLQLVPLDFEWDNPLGGDFNLPTNWSDDLLPLPSDSALWNLGSVAGYTVQFGTNVATDSAIILTDNVTYDLDGYTYSMAALHATTGLVVGLAASDNAELTIVNGTLTSRNVRVAAEAGGQGALTVADTGILNVDENLVLGDGAGTLLVERGGRVEVGGSLIVGEHGRMEGDGVIAGLVDNQSGIVAPGATVGRLRIEGDYIQQADSALRIELGGSDNSDPENPEYDVLAIDETATLDGQLEVVLADLGGGPFSPELDDTFEILTASNEISGQFASYNVPELAGVTWLLDSTPSTLSLSLTDVPADFSGNGWIDGGDFLIWQRGFGIGSEATRSEGDTDGDGDVDHDDLANWSNQFGKQVLSSPASALSAVPEPGTCVLVMGALLATFVFSRRPATRRPPTARVRDLPLTCPNVTVHFAK